MEDSAKIGMSQAYGRAQKAMANLKAAQEAGVSRSRVSLEISLSRSAI
jgi:hypothetical protein